MQIDFLMKWTQLRTFGLPLDRLNDWSIDWVGTDRCVTSWNRSRAFERQSNVSLGGMNAQRVPSATPATSTSTRVDISAHAHGGALSRSERAQRRHRRAALPIVVPRPLA